MRTTPVMRDLVTRALDKVAAAEVVHSLRRVVPLIHLSPKDAMDPMAQQIVSFTANIAARIFPMIVLDLPAVKTNSLLLDASKTLDLACEDLILKIEPTALVDHKRNDDLAFSHAVNIGGDGETNLPSLRVDAHGWLVHYSRENGAPSWNGTLRQHHPASPIVAASFAGGWLLKKAVPSVTGTAGADESWLLNLLTYGASEEPNPQVETVALEGVFAFGAGSVGSAALVTLAHSKDLRGSITIIDEQTLGEDNMRRYVAMMAADAKKSKAKWAASFFDGRFPQLKISNFDQLVGQWASTLGETDKIPIALVSFDTKESRGEAVDLLPKACIHGATNRSMAEIVHAHFATTMCGYCAYVDQSKHDEGVTDEARTRQRAAELGARLNLNENRVLQLMYRFNKDLKPAPLAIDDTNRIAEAWRVSKATMASWEGRYLRDLMAAEGHRLYSAVPLGANRDPHAGTLSLPMVSALAGALLACELIKEVRADLHEHALTYGKYKVDVFATPSQFGLRNAERDPSGRCLCHNEDRQKWHARLWPEERQAILEWSKFPDEIPGP